MTDCVTWDSLRCWSGVKMGLVYDGGQNSILSNICSLSSVQNVAGRMSSSNSLLSYMSSCGSGDNFSVPVNECLNKVLAFLMVWPSYPVHPVYLVWFHHGECLPRLGWRLDGVMATVLPNQKEYNQKIDRFLVSFSKGGWKNDFCPSLTAPALPPPVSGKGKCEVKWWQCSLPKAS